MDEGDEVIIPEPFYAIYNGFTQMSGVVIKPIKTYLETGFALPEIEAFEAEITSKTKAILICNPNNPTGCIYPKATLKALAVLAKKYDLFLFVDEVYREFCYDGDFFSVLNIPDMEEHIIVMDSVSKRYSACGARVGAMVTRNAEVLNTVVKFSRLRLSAPTLGQLLAEGSLQEPTEYLENAVAEYKKRRETVFQRLSQMEGVKCYLPQGAFYCFAELPIDNADRFCQWLLEDFSYHNKTVMLAPGSGFYASAGAGEQQIRTAYVLNVNDLNAAMDCLENALAVYPYRVTATANAMQD